MTATKKLPPKARKAQRPPEPFRLLVMRSDTSTYTCTLARPSDERALPRYGTLIGELSMDAAQLVEFAAYLMALAAWCEEGSVTR